MQREKSEFKLMLCSYWVLLVCVPFNFYCVMRGEYETEKRKKKKQKQMKRRKKKTERWTCLSRIVERRKFYRKLRLRQMLRHFFFLLIIIVIYRVFHCLWILNCTYGIDVRAGLLIILKMSHTCDPFGFDSYVSHWIWYNARLFFVMDSKCVFFFFLRSFWMCV